MHHYASATLNAVKHTEQWGSSEMPLSENSYKMFVSRHEHNLKSTLANAVAEKRGPRGEMIYTPHDCEMPDAWETPLGSIWACYGSREGRMCYDQWICEDYVGTKRWSLFKRNMRG